MVYLRPDYWTFLKRGGESRYCVCNNIIIDASTHIRKFSVLYESYGLGAVKNIWLLVCLLPLARTVNLYKMKDYVGGVLGKDGSKANSDYKRLIRFFQDWGESRALLHDLMRQNLRFLRGLGFKTLVMDGTSWTLGEAKVHYLVLSVLVGSVAVPIYWVQLEKIGASSQAERKAMFEQAFFAVRSARDHVVS